MSYPEIFRCQQVKGPHRTCASRTPICQIGNEIRADLADRYYSTTALLRIYGTSFALLNSNC
jgi:hypothetical protein